MELNQYALLFGLALIVLIAALAAAIVFQKRRLIGGRHRDSENGKYIEYPDFERSIAALRHEFRHSIDGAQASARKATTVGENVIAAVKPIELALRHLNSRLATLEEQAGVNANLLVELKSSIDAQEQFSEEGERAVGRIASRVEEFEQQIAAVTDQLPTLKEMIERLREDADRRITGVIDDQIAEIQKQINVLISRLDLGEKGCVADLSDLTKSLVASLPRRYRPGTAFQVEAH